MFNQKMSEVNNPYDPYYAKEFYRTYGLRVVGSEIGYKTPAKGPTIDRGESAKDMADRSRERELKRTKELAEKMKKGQRLPDASDRRW
jgi:hypothetical protein